MSYDRKTLENQGSNDANNGRGPRNDFGSNAVAKQIYDNAYNNKNK